MGVQLSRPVRIESISKTDVIIAVVGRTGAGKSTFINSILKKEILPFRRRTGTREIQHVEHSLPLHGRPRQRVILAEVPGFEAEGNAIFDKKVKAWLEKLSSKALTLFGIVYVHRITDKELSIAGLHLIERQCEALAMIFPSRVALVTTMWDGLHETDSINSVSEEIHKSWGETVWAQSSPTPQATRFDKSSPDGATGILSNLLQELEVGREEDVDASQEEDEEIRDRKFMGQLEDKLKKAREGVEMQRKRKWELEREARDELEEEATEAREQEKRERTKRVELEKEKKGLERVNRGLEMRLKDAKDELEEAVEVANEREAFNYEEREVWKTGIRELLLQEVSVAEEREAEEQNEVGKLEEELRKIRERKEIARQMRAQSEQGYGEGDEGSIWSEGGEEGGDRGRGSDKGDGGKEDDERQGDDEFEGDPRDERAGLEESNIFEGDLEDEGAEGFGGGLGEERVGLDLDDDLGDEGGGFKGDLEGEGDSGFDADLGEEGGELEGGQGDRESDRGDGD